MNNLMKSTKSTKTDLSSHEAAHFTKGALGHISERSEAEEQAASNHVSTADTRKTPTPKESPKEKAIEVQNNDMLADIAAFRGPTETTIEPTPAAVDV